MCLSPSIPPSVSLSLSLSFLSLHQHLPVYKSSEGERHDESLSLPWQGADSPRVDPVRVTTVNVSSRVWEPRHAQKPAFHSALHPPSSDYHAPPVPLHNVPWALEKGQSCPTCAETFSSYIFSMFDQVQASAVMAHHSDQSWQQNYSIDIEAVCQASCPFDKTVAVVALPGPATSPVTGFGLGLQFRTWILLPRLGIKFNQKAVHYPHTRLVSVVPLGSSCLARWYYYMQGQPLRKTNGVTSVLTLWHDVFT